MKTFNRIISAILCVLMMLSCISGIAFAAETEDYYDTLFEKAYVINSSWTDADLVSGNTLTFTFRGVSYSEQYNAARHFASHKAAQNYYLSGEYDILDDVPVYLFCAGEYPAVYVRYSGIILGANAGINPNEQIADFTAQGVKNGVALNSARTDETVFTGGIHRTTRIDGNSDSDTSFQYNLVMAEKAEERTMRYTFTIDGVKITGSKGISLRDLSITRDYVYNDETFSAVGYREQLVTFKNSIVDSFSGTGMFGALVSSHENSYNYNDIVFEDVRLTNITSGCLFHKYLRNLTVDGMYFANSSGSFLGNGFSDAAFSNSSTVSSVYDNNVEIKNSVFFNNSNSVLLGFGNAVSSGECTAQNFTFDNNIFYNSVSQNGYIFDICNQNVTKDIDIEVNITNNHIHQTNTIPSVFVGNASHQLTDTVLNFNSNRVTGAITSIFPDLSAFDATYVTENLSYNFDYNFFADDASSIGQKPVWTTAPTAPFENGYDVSNILYYTDFTMTTLGADSVFDDGFDITEVTGLGDNVTITGNNINVKLCCEFGNLTPVFTVGEGKTAKIYADNLREKEITTIDAGEIVTTASYIVVVSDGVSEKIYYLTLTADDESLLNSLDEIDASEFNFPTVSVNTADGGPLIDSKEIYTDCSVSIGNTDAEYVITDATAGIRYRGNSTYYNSTKKAYRIKFESKQDVFGFGKAKSWVLLANSFDKTMLRNAIAFEMAQKLGLEYTSYCRFVNVYLNNEYIGVYLLCEQTQTGTNRVDIEEDETGKVDTGYLLELTGNADADEVQFIPPEVDSMLFGKGVNVNWRTGTMEVVLKTPDPATDEQIAFASDYFNAVNTAILSQDMETFAKYCDVETFAKTFLVHTIMNNGDSGFQMYMYKKEDGGLLYSGPVWDFDRSSAACTHVGNTYDKWYSGSQNPWFDSFANWHEFMVIVDRLYDTYITDLEGVIYGYTNDFYGENSYDFIANDVRWASLTSSYFQITSTVAALTTFRQNIDHLETWFDNRLNWLDTQMSKLDTLVTDISLPTSLEYLAVDSAFALSLTQSPLDAFSQIVFESSDPTVAYVSQKGVVTALKDGNAVITATVKGTDIKASTSFVCYDSTASDITEVDPSKFDLPVVHVNTNGAAIESKEIYTDCTVSTTNTTEANVITDAVAGIRLRGNSTQLADKKPYRIKFESKQNMFGMGKAKSWVLLANAFDKTMSRNAIAFAIAQQFGLEFTTLYQFVNVYLNGEYIGMYLMCEQTQTGSNRVDIEEDETGKVDTGYLLELTGNADADEICFIPEEVSDSKYGNWRTNTMEVVLKTPEPATDEQISFASNYFDKVNTAILTQDMDAFRQYADVESFAKVFLVNTIMNNADAGYQLYMYKKEDGGLLYGGPVWDFDQSSAAGTHGGNTYNEWYTGTVNPWYDSFSDWTDFLILSKKLYEDNIDEIEAIIDYYTNTFYYETIYDFEANNVKWANLTSDYFRITAEVQALTTYPDNFSHLETWFGNRVNWLDTQFASVSDTVTGIAFPDSLYVVNEGKTFELEPEFTPTFSSADLEWSSGNEDILTVQNGVITGLSQGYTTVTVKVVGTSLSATCNVSVVSADVTITDIENLDPSMFNFPVVNIDTVDSLPVIDKETYRDCSVSITNTEEDYVITEKVAGIRYRGNSTLKNLKAPYLKYAYRVKFDKKQDVFGFGKAKNWVLLANAFDKTMVRNSIAFSLATELGLDYTTHHQFVNFYLNGEYQGVYLLCEHTQTGDNRVEVEEDETGKVNTGFLFELAGNADDEDVLFIPEVVADSQYGNWRTNVMEVAVKTPDVDYITDEQIEFAENEFNKLNAAILTHDWEAFCALADVESFAKYFVVNTIMNNGDAGFQTYVYKYENDGKFCAGPVWDFDQSSAAGTHVGETYDEWYTGSVNPWFDSFVDWEEFMVLAKGIYEDSRDYIADIIDYNVNTVYAENGYDFDANEALWHNVLNGDFYRITPEIQALTTFEQNFEHLETWFANRLLWLDTQFGAKSSALTDIQAEDTVYITPGSTLNLEYVPVPLYARDYTVTAESENSNIASVSGMTLTGVNLGETTVTLTAGEVTRTVSVKVVSETMSGSVVIGDTYVVGDTVTPVIYTPDSNYEVVFYRNGIKVATGSYTVAPADAGQTLHVEVVGEMGKLVSNVATMTKNTPAAPTAPSLKEKLPFGVVLVTEEGYEYSIDGNEWQTEGTFTDLTEGTQYNFYRRTVENSYSFASPASEPLTVTAQGLDAPLFTEAYQSDVISNSALLVSDHAANVSTGDFIYSNWDGTTYVFVAGINAFSTLADAMNYASEQGISQPEILYTLTSGASLNITDSVKIYAPNYKTSPYITDGYGVKSISYGADWKENSAYLNNQIIVQDIVIAASATGADIEVYGITFTGVVNDSLRTSSLVQTDIRLENIMKDGTTALMNGYIIRTENAQSKSNASNTDTLYIKNLYIRKTSANSRLIGEYCPAYTTFDGLYCDASASGLNTNVSWIKTYANNAVITFKNSNLRNWIKSGMSSNVNGIFQFEGYNRDDIGSRTSEIVFDNNILYKFVNRTDAQGTYYVFSWYANSYSDFTFTNNYVDLGYNSITSRADSQNTSRLFYTIGINSSNMSAAGYNDVVITGNILNGIENNISVESSSRYYSTYAFEIHDNYYLSSRVDDFTGVYGEQFLVHTNAAYVSGTSKDYWLDAKMTMSSNDYSSGSCGTNAKWMLDKKSGVLTISGSGAMSDYTGTTLPWYSDRAYIKTAVIGEGITALGNYAFYNAINLESVSLPSTLVDIGNSVFYNCKSLKNVEIPNTVTVLGTNVFRGCSALESIVLPSGITSVGSYAFYGCSTLTEITIPEKVTIIGNYALRNCTSLKTVYLPKGLTTINNYAFYGCDALTDIYFDGKEEEISITVNSNNAPFNNATKHYKTELITGNAGANATFTFDPDTAVLTITGTGTLWSPGLEAAKRPLVKEVVIEGLTSISANIFSGAHFTSLEKVTLPEGLTSLGKGAFTDCKKLTDINLPSSLKSIGELCFYNCKSLTKIDIPANVTSIGNSAFLGVVASDINFAGTRAMWDAVTIGTENARLSFVACSDDVRTILDKATKGDGAWIFNEANETLYFAGNTNFIKSYAEGAEMVPDEIAVKVKYIDIDETLGGFGAYTFSNMTNVISVTGGENIRYVGNYAFKNCSNLKSVSFTNAQYFGGIPYGLFANCTSLETVELSDSIKYFYGASFQGCSSLKEITIPAGAKAVGEYTFRNCTALETITLHEGITSFGAGAIQGCTSLKTINFPSTLKTIGQYAFYNVPSTLTVNFNGTQSQWNTVYVREGNVALNYLTVNCK